MNQAKKKRELTFSKNNGITLVSSSLHIQALPARTGKKIPIRLNFRGRVGSSGKLGRSPKK